MTSYTFVQLADTQFGMVSNEADVKLPDGTIKHTKVLHKDLLKYSKAEIYEMEKAFSKRVVRAINAMEPKPKFAVVCGDLVHISPLKDRTLNREQVAEFHRVFAELDKSVRLVCVCGNHDIGNRPTAESIEIYKDSFGADYFSFFIDNDKYIVLNSQLYEDDTEVKQQAKDHDAWLRLQVQDATVENDTSVARRHAVLLSHIPPFIYNPEEPSAYFNFQKDIRKELLSFAVDHGVSHWFCGHYHRNAGGVFQKGDRELEVVITTAVGGTVITNEEENPLEIAGVGQLELNSSRSGLRIVTVNEDKISHEFKTLDQLVE